MIKMGFSPGDFITHNGDQYHWELKDGPRIVLWDRFEAKQLLSLSLDQANKALNQLDLLVVMASDEDH